jgi:hypothetical protein
MHTCPIDSYWSRQYSWEKVSAKNGLRSPYKSLNYHAHDVDHVSRTRLSVEGDDAVSACLLSILTHASEPSSLSAIKNVSAHTSNTSGNAYHTREVHIIVRGPFSGGSCLLSILHLMPSSYKKLFHELPWESPQGSPRSVAASDHSNTQSPPSSWSMPSQSESSSQQGTAWSQASSTDRASPSMSNQYISSQSRVQHSSFLNDGQTRQVICSMLIFLALMNLIS